MMKRFWGTVFCAKVGHESCRGGHLRKYPYPHVRAYTCLCVGVVLCVCMRETANVRVRDPVTLPFCDSPLTSAWKTKGKIKRPLLYAIGLEDFLTSVVKRCDMLTMCKMS